MSFAKVTDADPMMRKAVRIAGNVLVNIVGSCFSRRGRIARSAYR
jgi:hypothetical protein